MPSVYLELSGATEHKFYEATTEGCTLTLRYGRIGTGGQRQIKTLASPQDADAEAQKKLAEKRKKGYVEAVPGQTAKQTVILGRKKIPRLLKPYIEQIQATVRPVVTLTLNDAPTTVWNSKVGGIPYQLQGDVWPTNAEGQALLFLAQLNFAELPQLQEFPTAGILQFFIDADSIGSSDRNTDNFGQSCQARFLSEVIYDLEKIKLEGIQPYSGEGTLNPLGRKAASDGCLITGLIDEMPITPSDRLFELKTGINLLDESNSPDEDLLLGEHIEIAYKRHFDMSKGDTVLHQLGGYSTFIQDDPRTAEQSQILLFQLDSDYACGVIWGDMGIARFFINREDLTRGDFSKVFYHWDCS